MLLQFKKKKKKQLKERDLSATNKNALSRCSNNLVKFKASAKWILLFMSRNNLGSKRGVGIDVFFLSMEDVSTVHFKLQKQLYEAVIDRLANCEKMVVLFQCLLGRTVDD